MPFGVIRSDCVADDFLAWAFAARSFSHSSLRLLDLDLAPVSAAGGVSSLDELVLLGSADAVRGAGFLGGADSLPPSAISLP